MVLCFIFYELLTISVLESQGEPRNKAWRTHTQNIFSVFLWSLLLCTFAVSSVNLLWSLHPLPLSFWYSLSYRFHISSNSLLLVMLWQQYSITLTCLSDSSYCIVRLHSLVRNYKHQSLSLPLRQRITNCVKSYHWG